MHGAHVVELSAEAPETESQDLAGLLLSGGGDIDPARYRQVRHPKTGEPDAPRDELELRLARRAVRVGMPVLGICRGAQVLGAALGGSLMQDIPCQRPGAANHAQGACHWVQLEPASALARALGCERLEVNSFHHQANDALGETVRAVARSDDGVIEAIEIQGHSFATGVQWHPERMLREPPQVRLFEAFMAASRAYHVARLRQRR